MVAQELGPSLRVHRGRWRLDRARAGELFRHPEDRVQACQGMWLQHRPRCPVAADLEIAAGVGRLCASSLDDADPQFARKLEGLGLTQKGQLILVNDDDFGITGERVRVDIVTGAGFGR